MSFLPTSFWILIGSLGLAYFLAVAFLLIGCLKLQRVEHLPTWRIASYTVILHTAVVCLSTLASIGYVFLLTSNPLGGNSDWLDSLSTAISYSARILEWVSLGALVVALAYPLRKKAARNVEEAT